MIADTPPATIAIGHATPTAVVSRTGSWPVVTTAATSARPHDAKGRAWLVVTSENADPR